MLHGAEKLSDLTALSNSLEALRGDREGHYAVRVNDQFRLSLNGLWETHPTERILSLKPALSSVCL